MRAAPAQWYSFKPMWPADPDEAADLAARAAIMLAGRPDPGPSRALPRTTDRRRFLPAGPIVPLRPNGPLRPLRPIVPRRPVPPSRPPGPAGPATAADDDRARGA